MDTKKLRQKILDLAIRGKLVPQDPNDEPASVLLERIRTEKERLIKEGKIKRSKKTASDDEIEAPFEIPESWEWCRLEEVCNTCLGKMLDKQKNQGIMQPYLRNVNVRWDCFDLTDLLQMPFKEDEEERYSVKYGDLVVCEGGEPGRCAIWNNNESIKFQKALHRVRCFNGIINKYIECVLKLYAFNGFLGKFFTGSTIKHLTGDALDTLPIPLPPTSGQMRIVNEVERWFTLIDELESNEGDLLRAIDKAKSKILDLAIHGKLVPQDPNDEPAIELLKRINPKFEPCDNVNDLPKKWIQATLGDIGKWKSGGTPDRKIKSYYNNGQIPWLKIADIQDGYVKTAEEFITQEGLDNSSASINPVGSIALAMYGSIGKVGILTFPAATNQAICVCSDYVIEQKYLFYFLLSQRSGFYMMAGGGVQANISKQIIVKYPISIPPYNEQLRIVAKIKELFAVLNSIKKSLE